MTEQPHTTSEAPEPTTSEPEKPAAPKPAAPKPTMFARRQPAVVAPASSSHVSAHGAPETPSASAAFGRVGDDGVVFVRTADGEREVGSYPGATPQEALAYFARKYDEVKASADLLQQRVEHTDISTKDASEGLTKLKEQAAEPHAVGDLEALAAQVSAIEAVIATKREHEQAARAAARAQAREAREAIVSEAEQIAGTPEDQVRWKQSAARMRELFDDWQAAQKGGPRLDKDSESSLWKRFSAARNSFDKARRTHFAALDQTNAEVKRRKEALVARAESLATSKDWNPTARAFKDLMADWRDAGRAGKSDDDALWARFKAAQDSFFAAKDEVVAAEEADFKDNLAVKEGLLARAEALLPITDLAQAKSALRTIQDSWDAAGKVPRADIDRMERGLRRVEQAVRDADDGHRGRRNPEAAHRAQSLADQLEAQVASLRDDLEQAQASGNARKIKDAKEALAAREQWLELARKGLSEFG